MIELSIWFGGLLFRIAGEYGRLQKLPRSAESETTVVVSVESRP